MIRRTCGGETSAGRWSLVANRFEFREPFSQREVCDETVACPCPVDAGALVAVASVTRVRLRFGAGIIAGQVVNAENRVP
jgi:hypothetical protein